jgi:hypothetical protein
MAEDRFPPDLLWEQQLVSSRAARAALQSLLRDMMFPEIRSDP